MRLAVSIGLLTGAFAAPALAQSPPVTANPFPAARDVTTIAPSASEELAAERILTAPRIWASLDYGVLYSQNANTPALIQVVPNRFAVQGNTPTEVTNNFPSARDLEYRAISGFRIGGGYQFRPDLGVDGSVFWTETLTRTGFASATGALGSDGVARPYIQAGTGTAISLYSALPGQYGGSVAVTTSLSAAGGDANLRKDTYRFFVDRNEWLAGFRYLELSERVQITDRSLIAGTTFTTLDEFQTRNQFYGGQIGMHSRLYGVRWSLDFINKFGLGGVHQQVRAFGSNSIIANGVEDRQALGLYAREGNTGFFERNKFAATAESQVIASYYVTENFRVHLGYTGTWISSVIRAPEVIDPNVNDSRVRFVAQPAASTANVPEFRWNRASDFFLQGLTFGASMGF